MANPVWPGTLPQTILLGLQDVRGAATIRFSNDAGPAQVRKLFSNATRTVTRRVVLTQAQRIALDTFFVETLEEGSLPFDFVDTVTGLACAYRFLQPPSYVHTATTASANFCEASVTLERLP